jgi:hypothetical protein
MEHRVSIQSTYDKARSQGRRAFFDDTTQTIRTCPEDMRIARLIQLPGVTVADWKVEFDGRRDPAAFAPIDPRMVEAAIEEFGPNRVRPELFQALADHIGAKLVNADAVIIKSGVLSAARAGTGDPAIEVAPDRWGVWLATGSGGRWKVERGGPSAAPYFGWCLTRLGHDPDTCHREPCAECGRVLRDLDARKAFIRAERDAKIKFMKAMGPEEVCKREYRCFCGFCTDDAATIWDHTKEKHPKENA